MEFSLDLSHLQTFSTGAFVSQIRRKRNQLRNSSCTCHLFVQELLTLIAGLSNGEIIVWKSNLFHSKSSAKHSATMKGHRGQIHSLKHACFDSFSLLFSGSSDRNIRVWNPWTEEVDRSCIQTLVGHHGTVTAIEFARDQLMTASTDCTIRIWGNDETRDILLYPSFVVQQVISNFTDWVTSLHCRVGDVTTLYAGDSNGEISKFASNTSSSIQTQFKLVRARSQVHERGISHLVVVGQENFIVTLSYDFTAQVHDAVNGNAIFAIDNPNRCRFTGVDWSCGRDELVLVDALGYVQIWNVFAETCIKVERLRQGELNGVTTIDGNKLSISAPECIEIWQIVHEEITREFIGHQGPVLSLVLLPKNNDNKCDVIYSASVDNTVRLWTVETMKCFAILKETKSEISSMVHWKNSNFLFTGLDNGDIHLWNVDSGSAIALKDHTNTVSSMVIAYTSTRDFLLSASFDGKVVIWNINKKRNLHPSKDFELQVGNHEVLTVAFNTENESIVAGGNDNCVHIWDLHTLELCGVLHGHTSSVTCIAFDAKFIFSGSEDCTIKAWDSLHLFNVFTLKGHTQCVEDLVFVSQCNALLSCSSDGRLLMWNYTSQSIIHTFQHSSQLRCMVFDKHRQQVLIGTDTSSIIIFQLTPNMFVETRTDIDTVLSTLQTIEANDLSELCKQEISNETMKERLALMNETFQ